jgi:hypothetical protein
MISNLQSQVAALQTEVGIMQTEVAGLTTDIAALDTDVATLNEKTIYQSAGSNVAPVGGSPEVYTRFTSDLKLSNGISDNVILSNSSLQNSTFNGGVTINDNLKTNSLTTTTISTPNIYDTITIGSNTQFGNVIINGTVYCPLGFTMTTGFFSQF